MSDGKWSGSGTSEVLRQSLSRQRFLSVDLGVETPTIGTLDPGLLISSWYTAISPNDPSLNYSSSAYPYGGPHFIMSPQTPDEAHTFGVQLCLIEGGVNLAVAINERATPRAGGFVLTLWCLISISQQPNGLDQPIWASLNPQTGVGFNELYHSFDINASAIRLQIENGECIARGNDAGVIGFTMVEL